MKISHTDSLQICGFSCAIEKIVYFYVKIVIFAVENRNFFLSEFSLNIFVACATHGTNHRPTILYEEEAK